MPPRLPLRSLPRSIDAACLLRRNPPVAPFSSTSRLKAQAPGAKKKTGTRQTQGPPKKGVKNLVLKKKARAIGHNPPHEGERKAFKNRIILSNTNAQEVPDLHDLSVENMADNATLGKVMAIPGPVVDSLRTLGAFKRNQGWSNYRRPACLVTEDSWNLGKIMEDLGSNSHGNGDSSSNSIRRVISGQRKSGKSVLLLQAMAMAILRKWVVINIPESRELVDAHTNYAPIPGTSPTQYMQMTAASKLLKSLLDANKSILKSMVISKAYQDIPLDPKNNVTLFQLAEQGIQDPDKSWKVFLALWEELTLPNTSATESLGRRPPILYCADNISHLFVPSQYQVVDDEGKVQPIHSLDLALPRHFIDYIIGAKTFPNGGMTLGAISKSDFVTCPPLEVGIELGEARQSSPNADLQVSDYWNPLQRIDQRVLDLCLNLNVVTLKGVSKEDTKAIIQYWAFNGLVRDRMVDSWIGEKWALSGGGVLGELEKAVVRTRF